MKLTTQITASTPFFYFLETIEYIAKKSWLEGNSGSMSMLMDMEDIWSYIIDAYNPQEYPLQVSVPKLGDQFILITGNQVPLRNVAKFKFKLHRMVGIIQVNYAGDGYKIVWGFQDGCLPTSFLNAHLLIHNERLKINSNHRVLIHSLPTNLVQKTYLDKIQNEFQFSYDIWNSMPDIVKWTPEGIGLIDFQNLSWESCFDQITKKFHDYRLVVLKYFGVMVSGQSWDDVITMLEYLDKAAANSIRLVKEEEYAIKPAFFQNLEKEQNLTFNPLVLKYGNLPKNKIYEVIDNEQLDSEIIEEKTKGN